MSWLGSGISQITGQISNFTKEVLTEGTEEVDDHVTELKVSQDQNRKLEQQCFTQKAETDRLKHLIEELTEKLESSELQLSTISDSYRAQLNLREDEVKTLKQQQNELLDSHSKIEQVQHHHHQGLAGAVGDEHDFDDVISSQHEINRLRSEVQRLSAQNQHWRQRAGAANTQSGEDGTDGSGHTSDVQTNELHAKIQELERKLQQEVDHHQHELAALQDAHSAKTAQLKRAHKQEVQQLKKQAESKGSDEESVARLTSRVQELERDKKSLEDQLESVKSEAGDLSMRINMREASLPSSTPRPAGKRLGSIAESADLSGEVLRLQEQVSGYEEEAEQFELIRSDLEMEKDALQEVLLKLRLQLKEKEDVINNLQKGNQSQTGAPTSNVDELNSQINSLKQINSKLQTERDQLLKKEDTLQSEIDSSENKVKRLEVEVEQSRANTSQQLLELESQLKNKSSELLSLEQQLQQKEDEEKKLSSQMEEFNSSLVEKESENDALVRQLQQLEDQIKQQQDQIKQQQQQQQQSNGEQEAVEVTSLQKELEEQRAALEEQTQQLRSSETQLETLRGTLEERDAAFQLMTSEKTSLEASLEELDEQHTEALQEIIRKRDELIQANSKLKKNVEELETKLNESISEEREGGEEAVRKMESELREAEVKAKELLKEKEEKVKDLEEMKQKLNQGATALNELHMDKRELEDTVKKLQEELKKSVQNVGDLSKEKRDLEELHRMMEEEFNATREELSILRDNTAHSHLQEELLQMRENLNESQKLSSEYELKVGHFEAELEKLQEKLTASYAEKLKLSSVMEDSEQVNNKQREEVEERIRALITENEALKTQRETLERELDAAERKLSEQAKQYEACIQGLRDARDLDTSSLEAEHEKLIKCNQEKELRISELKTDCSQLQAQVSDTKDMLQDTISGQQSLTEVIGEKESEISALKSENSVLTSQNLQLTSQNSDLTSQNSDLTSQNSQLTSQNSHLTSQISELKQTLEENTDSSRAQQTDLNRLVELEKQYKLSEENNEKLKQEIETLKIQVEANDAILQDGDSEKDDKITELNVEVDQLRSTLEEQKTSIKTYQERIETLESQGEGRNFDDDAVAKQYEDTIQELRSSISFVQYDLASKSSELQQAKDKITRLNNEINEYQAKLAEATSAKESSDGTNSDDGSSSQATEAQVEEMRTLISQKDDIVNELKNNNEALLRMLEERSMQLHGDRTLVELHKLENELRSLRMEKEQIMNVLNEKSRECSTLKGEVHRLMSVISQEKAALSKLQQDNNELVKNNMSDNRTNSQAEEGNREMTKEAVKKLSQIIRDKDLEIESLTQKNETLLQVLQETGGSANDAAGAQLGSLMQDKENLMKQVQLFQKDREQIITALNQKHQEVAVYYTELQKLSVVHKEVTDQQDELSRQFKVLQHQYEDKQQQLIKSQKELVSFKQKYTEADNRYNELLQRRSESPREITTNGYNNKENGAGPDKNRESPFQVIKEEIEEVQVQNVQQVALGKRSHSPQHNTVAPSLVEEKQREIESLRTQSKKLRENVSHKESLLEDLKKRLENKETLVQQRDTVISEKDKTTSELNARVHRAEEKISQRDTEISTIRKQQENLAFQLQGLQTELQDTAAERDQVTGQVAGLHSEIAMLKETKSKFSMELSQKELELNGMREKVKSLQAFVQEEKGTIEKGTMDQMLAETEAMQKQAHMFQQERDQAYMALQQKQSEGLSMQNQIGKLQEKEGKLTREVERLRTHLLQIEDGYTQEAIAAEDREKELRNRLAAAEEKALSSSHAVHAASQEATEQVEVLQQQLHALASQRDSALLELSAAQEQATQYSTSLNNLQIVLEQFQHERELQQAAEIEKYQRDLESSRIQCLKQQNQLNALQSELDETQNALQAAQRLSEQLDKKTEAIAALKEEVNIRENALKQMEAEMGKLANLSDSKVDKALVKNLFIGYFHTPNAKRQEVLHVIASVLGLSEEETREISPGGAGPAGWLTGLFRRGGTNPGSTPSTPSKSLDKSFSELFVTFLERESSPRPQVRLPTDQMVKDQQHRAQGKARAAFNPFSIPAHGPVGAPGAGGSFSAGFGSTIGGAGGGSILTSGGGMTGQNILTDPGGGSGSSHLLMSTTSRSSFSPVTVLAQDGTAPQGSGGGAGLAGVGGGGVFYTAGGKGRASASSSGRNTPSASSTNILRDVLHN